ncbi:MAG: HlyC/CorC family transporter [SAR202 cluster bacterium]|nr:HlyC/CorC family transporter [SAR202 cluster bacterium]|tara:strand:+ start:99376 stop:100623 length:1248 start_codon:yes stop_codon:yes gene_type:complete
MEIDSTIAWLVIILSLIGHLSLLLIGNSFAFADPENLDQNSTEKSYGLITVKDRFSSAFLFFRVIFLFLAAFFLLIGFSSPIFGNYYLTILVCIAYILISNFIVDLVLVFNSKLIARSSSGISKVVVTFFDLISNFNRTILKFIFKSKNILQDDDLDDSLREVSVPVDSVDSSIVEHEIEMIKGVVSLDRITAREVMVPRVDIEALSVDTPINEIAKKMAKSGHSRIPVFDPDLDHVKGIVYARDILVLFNNDDQVDKKISPQKIRPALFIPESKSLSELLSEFKDLRVHIAIVVDEHGGVSGLVTIDDLLEEIVGDIQDEFDLYDSDFEVISNKEFVIDAHMTLEKLSEISGVGIEGDGFDTVAGFVYSKLGRIPSVGDFVDFNRITIEVVETTGRRIKKLKLTGDFPQVLTKK